MKKTVLTYGLISGVISAGLMLAAVPFMDGSTRSLIVGYAGIVLSALLIVFGVRSYREEVGHGKISFGRGLPSIRPIRLSIMRLAASTIFWLHVWG